jgi:anti-anti-sigma factor
VFFPEPEVTMELHISHEEGYVLANTSGPIDESSEDLFVEYLHPLLGQRGTSLVLDLSKSDRINSAGLTELVRLVINANTNGSRVVFAACSPFVSTVFTRSGLYKFFDVAESLSEAISEISDR